MDRSRIIELVKQLPVSVNNIADPSLQYESTAKKLSALFSMGHNGPVGLITKGNLSSQRWRELLKDSGRKLPIYLFSTISGLPDSVEPVAQEHRFKTLRSAREAGVKSIMYLRPLVHGLNDGLEELAVLLKRAADSGAHAIVASGIKAAEEGHLGYPGLDAAPPADGQGWTTERKVIAYNVEQALHGLANNVGLPLFRRTQCAVAYLSGAKRSLQPYDLAPQHSGCEWCPLKGTCTDRSSEMVPTQGALELLDTFGYDVEFHPASDTFSRCTYAATERHKCDDCCTTCDELKSAPWIDVKSTPTGATPSWGDFALVRFLTGGVLTYSSGEHTRDGTVNIPTETPLYAVNSWTLWGDSLPWDECFRCIYCFLPKQFNGEKVQTNTVGANPAVLLEYLGIA